MWLARALAAGEIRPTARQLPVRTPREHDYLVLLGPVRLHVHETIHRNSFRLPLSQLPSTDGGVRYTWERAYAGSRAPTRNGAVAAKPTAITSAPATASKMKWFPVTTIVSITAEGYR